MIAVIALCWTASAGFAADVHLTRERYLALQPANEAEPDAPGPMVVGRTLELDVGVDSVAFVARYRLFAPDPGWLDLALAAPGVRLDSARVGATDLALAAGGDGVHVTVWVDGTRELVARGTLIGEVARGLVLPLLPGAGTVTVRGAAALDGAVAVGPQIWWTSESSVRLVPPSQDAAPPSLLVLGEAGLGLTVGDGELRVRSRLRWRVARGRVDSVAFTVPGAGPDLEVTGPQVAAFRRTGDRVEVDLVRSESTLVALEARWTTAVPDSEEARVSIPMPRLEGAFRTSTALQLARDGQVEVVPEATGLEGTASSELPDWAGGLVEGTPTAAYVGDASAGGSLALYRFQPAEAPPTLVDVAQYTVATTQEGRMLVRGHLQVRNDRGASLRVVPPEGVEVIGVRVAGETADVAREGRATIVPLAKSVETVEGLLSFPVELTLLGEGDAWGRVVRGTLPLPTLDVEVAVTRATVHLPPGYRNRLDPGESGVVVDFTEGQGITYGFAVGDARAAQADTLFQSAVSSWMANDFDEAQQLLEDLEGLGAANEDVKRLQGNLDLVLKGDGGGGDVALERRVKEQARARSQEEVVEQQRILEEAERSYSSGEYEKAEEEYRRALDIGDKLGKLANVEDKEMDLRNDDVQQRLDKAKQKKAEKSAILTQDFLQDIPTGRTFESTIGFAAGADDTGVAGGVEGGVVGGVLGGVVGGEMPAADPSPEPTRSNPKPIFKVPAVDKKDEAANAPPPPPIVTRDESEALEPLSVTAASLSVVVPTIGEPVRYQRLLLPASAPVEVPIRARRTRRNR